MKIQRVCIECEWHGTNDEVLRAANPFDTSCEIIGCPDCKEVNRLRTTCDEPGCWEQDTCGIPTPQGYRRTCGKHIPQINP